MKCTHCGAEVDSQRFCIYCGQPLQTSESGIHAKRAPRRISGVMRMRRHAAVSQSSLPEVQENPKKAGRAALCMNGSETNQDVIFSTDTEVRTAMNDQSRELESLLLKLNEKHNSTMDVSEMDYSEEKLLDDSGETQLETGDASSETQTEVSEREETQTSGPIPVGSGSFARIPSGGFHPLVETVKSACLGMVSRLRKLPSKMHLTSRKSNSSEENKKISDESLQIERERKKFIISSVIAAISVIALLIIVVKYDREETDYTAIAAQTMGNGDYALAALDQNNQDITTLTFDGQNFVVPDLFNEGDVDGDEQIDTMSQQVAPKQAAIPADPIAPAAQPKQGKSRLTEPRIYGRKDNVMAVPSAGESFKTKKQCIMREGPASRFGLVKTVLPGTTVKILASTEEDWVLNGNVWTKAGQPSKLGPGTQFENAVEGAKVPQATGRVISANNWRYVQVGDVYGYIGPVCFK